MIQRIAIVCLLIGASFLSAEAKITFDTPYGSGIDNILDTVKDEGWESVSLALTDRALESYENGEQAAENWYYLSRWARLFSSNEADIINNWIDAIDKAKLGHTNMAQRYTLYQRPLGEHLPLSLKRNLLHDIEFSREFFDLLSPYEFLPGVLDNLSELHKENRKFFNEYRNLAIAIAVVYDVPPPPGWPHYQVPQNVLPRELPKVNVSFDYWVRLNEKKQCAFDITEMSAEALKFLVDTTAMEDFRWVQSNIHNDPKDFASVYDRIDYRFDRIANNQFNWKRKDYRLETILNYGGICVDQAYFAAQTGKAKGIPTLVFRGAGMDGRHAWFGFMLKEGVWEFNGGRQGENRYVTGYAHDPQTWGNITDHQLRFLGEGFRRSHYYRQSLIHSNFALDYFKRKDEDAAIKASETALRYEKRNQSAWEILVSATKIVSDDAREVEALLRLAALAFREYPDLESQYLNRVIKSLENRGELSRAQREKYFLTIKHKSNRADISIQQAAERLLESMAEDPLSLRLRYYRVIIRQLGKLGSMDVYDRIVLPFVRQLSDAGNQRDAYKMLIFARDNLEAVSGSMLDQELKRQIDKYKP